MTTSNSPNRRRPKARIALESLETRELMTGGAGNTFAVMPGSIKSQGSTAEVTFTIDPSHFTLPHGKMTLGIDVVAQSATTFQPQVTAVKNAEGHFVHFTHAVYDPRLKRSNASSGGVTSAVTVPISLPADGKPTTYTVVVSGMKFSTGNFLLGFYLPGDASGTGTVTKADLTSTRKLLRVNANQSKYAFYTDANRDGRISPADVSLVRQNMGVTVNVLPIITSNLNPASVTVANTRTTSKQVVNFSGSATPGATIVYTNNTDNNLAQTVTADSKGNYSVDIPLVPGKNNMSLTTHDSFGQSISGAIDPVTYFASAASSTSG